MIWRNDQSMLLIFSYQSSFSKLKKKRLKIISRAKFSFHRCRTNWYTKRQLGKNMIAKMMTKICNTAGINEMYKSQFKPTRNLRNTDVQRLKIKEKVIMQITSHWSVMRVRIYKKISDVLIKDSQGLCTEIPRKSNFQIYKFQFNCTCI